MYEHRTTLPNPFKGRKGIFNRVNRVVFSFMGPAQVGIGRPEEPYTPPSDPVCPLCSVALADHEIRRGDAHTSTQVICP